MKKYKSHTTTILLLILGSSNLPSAEPPAWWAERGVLVPGATADDFAVANLGQLKLIAIKAKEEMDLKLASIGGAGDPLRDFVTALPGTDYYRAFNQGELKTVASRFFDRLEQLGYVGRPLLLGQTYPWTATPADDDAWAVANLGQLKFLFSFNIGAGLWDADGDGMDDRWEIQHFGSSLGNTGHENTDGDAYSNIEEYLMGTDPTTANTPSGAVSSLALDYDELGRLKITTGYGTSAYNPDEEGNIK